MHQLTRRLKNSIPLPRYEHCLRVAEAGERLAEIWGAPRLETIQACLLHDCARDLPRNILLKWGVEFGIIISEIEHYFPVLLHAPVGAEFARHKYGITDEQVLDAIRWHTTGRAAMSLLEKITFLSDYTEDGRSFPGIERVRALVDKDLDEALLVAFDQKINYVLQQGWPVHPSMIEARNWLILNRD